jgi:hypothetical protein
MIRGAAVGLNLNRFISAINKLKTNESGKIASAFHENTLRFCSKRSAGSACYVGFEVLTAVFIKSPIFLDMLHAGFLLGLFLDREDGGDMFLRNVG